MRSGGKASEIWGPRCLRCREVIESQVEPEILWIRKKSAIWLENYSKKYGRRERERERVRTCS